MAYVAKPKTYQGAMGQIIADKDFPLADISRE